MIIYNLPLFVNETFFLMNYIFANKIHKYSKEN